MKDYYDDYDDDWDYGLDWDMDALHKHKKGDKVKWILTAIAFVLMAVMLVGLCLQVFGTGKQKPSEWFGKDEQTEAENTVITTTARLTSTRAVRVLRYRSASGQRVYGNGEHIPGQCGQQSRYMEHSVGRHKHSMV